MKNIWLIIIFLLSLATVNAQVKEDSTSDPNKVKFIFDDIDNFYKAITLLDQAKSTFDSINIIRTNFIDKGSSGFKEYWNVEKGNGRNIEQEYLKIIRMYPKYFQSLRSSIKELPNQLFQYRSYFQKMKELYPEAVFFNNYFSIGFFNTQGQMLNSGSVFVSTEATLTNSSVDYSEFSDMFSWLREDAVGFKGLGYLIVHENLHSQQERSNVQSSFLHTVIVEGAAVFLTELICGKESLIGPAGLSKDMFEKANDTPGIWEEFLKDLENNNSSQWFFNEGGKYPFSMGYYMGYMICKDYYERSKNKKEAINALVKVYDAELIFSNSSYYK
ncbi:DUF2268 domain-containing putative Zn-dependent protease [Elizabethkingia anophelis]|uniref:DUF2268 domain-containing putative Zn-dependent protease n=1 Tax=Elizabethkingia anophelis TaxID=1117645 RepID=UPI0037870AF7